MADQSPVGSGKPVQGIEDILATYTFHDNLHLCLGPAAVEIAPLFDDLFQRTAHSSSTFHYVAQQGSFIVTLSPVPPSLHERLAALSPPLPVKTLVTARCAPGRQLQGSEPYQALARQLIRLVLDHHWGMAYLASDSEIVAVHYGGI